MKPIYTIQPEKNDWSYYFSRDGVYRFGGDSPLGEIVSEKIFDRQGIEPDPYVIINEMSHVDDKKYFAVGLGFFVAVVLFVIYLVSR